MLDRTIPFYNTILKCDHYQHKEVVLPCGFSIVPYQNGFEKAWAELEYAIGDFDSLDEAEHYFVETYLQNQVLFSNILFILSPDKSVVGSCIAWQDKRQNSYVSSLHWLVVDEKYHGMGLGRALCCAVMNIYKAQERLPVYIHTQPWSWKAIFLYLSLGFKLQKSDSFAHYVNQYDEAMTTLKKVVAEKQVSLLEELSES